MIVCNLVGVGSSSYAMVTFLKFGVGERKRRAKKTFLCALIASFCIAYACFDAILIATFTDADVDMFIIQNLGRVGAGISCAMFAAPLAELRNVIRSKSTQSLSVPWAAACFLCGFLWTVHGVNMGDPYVALPNMLGAVLAAFQFVLFLRFGVDRTQSYGCLPVAESMDLSGQKMAFGL